jgi:hypothetical protein
MESGRQARFRLHSSRYLNCHSNFIPNIRMFDGKSRRANGVKSGTGMDTRRAGESEMGRYELPAVETAIIGTGPASGEALFALGLMYSAGNSVPVDLVEAHKWFNLAAMNGHADAARLRREIAAEMADAEIGKAQLAAREWLKLHPARQATPCAAAARLQVAA